MRLVRIFLILLLMSQFQASTAKRGHKRGKSLTLQSSNGSRPSIRIKPSILSTELIDGAIEFDGQNFYFTQQGSRKTLKLSESQGPQGDKGDQGEKGDQGPQGPSGPIGLQGPAGPNGSISPSGVTGSIQFSDGTNLNSDNGNLFWDNTNKRLGVGNSTPITDIEVSGSNIPAVRLQALNTNYGYAILNNTTFDIITNVHNTHFKSAADTGFSPVLITTALAGSTHVLTVDNYIGTFTNLILKGGANQSGNTAELQNDAGTILSVFDNGARLGLGINNPSRPLHVSEALRIEPQSSAPGSAGSGDLYVDSDGTEALCVYLNGAWVVAAGGGTCS